MGDNSHRPLYWSTLEEYEGDPDVLARQGGGDWNTKPKGFSEHLEALGLSELTLRRRTFLKMSGFAAVLAAVSGCEKPAEKILPYVNAPEEIVPGVATHYASTCGGCEAACGVIVKTREARPIKIEGNPNHLINKGRLCARGQASILSLYDPDRIGDPVEVKSDGTLKKTTWDLADQQIVKALKSAGKRAVLLTNTIHGPARTAIIDRFKTTFPGLRHVVYDTLAEAERVDARELAYGERVLPRYHFDKSEVTVLLGSDPMADGASPVEFMAGIAEKRKLQKDDHDHFTMGSLYAFEPLATMSGMNADYRFAVKSDDLLNLALAIASQLASDGHSEVSGINLSVDPGKVESEIGLAKGTIKKVADDLWAARGKSLVYTGGLLSRTANIADLHVAVNLINSMLGNEGVTVDASRPSNQSQGSTADILALIDDMDAGNVDVLLIDGVNPVYSLPESARFASALKSVSLKVSFDRVKSETSAHCDLILPGLHYLEAWGDAEPIAGFLSIQQPTIGKIKGNQSVAGGALWNNRAFEQSIIAIARLAGSKEFDVELPQPEPIEGKPAPDPIPPRMMTWHEFLMKTWETEVFAKGGYRGSFQDFWFATLRQGVLDATFRVTGAKGARKLNVPGVLQRLKAATSVKSSGLSLSLYTLPNTYDGRDANNPWLLELPDPVTRVCWDNFVAVAPKFARENKLKDGQIIAVTANGVTVEGPVRIHPGMHESVLALGGGWGRTEAGAVGTGEGFNAYVLGAVTDGKVAYSGGKVEWVPTGKKTRLADVQGHNYMKLDPTDEHEPERQIVQATSLEMMNENPQAPQPTYHIPYWEVGQEMPDQWRTKDFHYTQHKWVMAIDLNACIGCNACMVACQAENNIPVVGKREVLVGREMHWIRIDRYYKGNPDNPEFAKQPMLCQQCDNAPCETVCPVLATVHSDEGLNQQVYNRCVGTRYCANNCPYKVRRFNFYTYTKFRKGPHSDDRVTDTPLALALNPDITVRTKGIMEKCTFCSQRLRTAKDEAKAAGQNIAEGQVKTACQQTCPAQAIHFGDALNPTHAVNAIREENKDKRGYDVLAELNVKPNIMYLAQVLNRETQEFDVKYHQKHHGAGHGDEHGADEHGGHEEHGHEEAPASHEEHSHGEGEQHSRASEPVTGVKS